MTAQTPTGIDERFTLGNLRSVGIFEEGGSFRAEQYSEGNLDAIEGQTGTTLVHRFDDVNMTAYDSIWDAVKIANRRRKTQGDYQPDFSTVLK